MVDTVQNQIRANKKKTKILVITFIGIVTGVVFFLSLILSPTNNNSIDWSAVLLHSGIALLLAALYCYISYKQMTRATLMNFNALEITEENDKQLYDIVASLTIAAHLPMPKVYLITDDNTMNAFATGPDPEHAIVAITNGLRQNMSRSQIEAVIGHELSHILNHDTEVTGLLIIMCSLIYLIGTYSLYFGWDFFCNSDRESKAFSLPFIIIGIVLIIFAYPITKVIQYAISRQREYLADANSIKLTGNPESLVSVFEVLKNETGDPSPYKNNAAQALFFNSPFKRKSVSISGLFSTHPPLDDRINRIKKLL